MQRSIAIRRASDEDAEAIVDVLLEATAAQWQQEFTEEDRHESVVRWRQRLASESVDAFVAILDGEVVAEAALSQTREEGGTGPPVPGSAHLGSIAVTPALWGQGIGSRLLDHATQWLGDAGFDTVECWTERTNQRSSHMYESRGWREIETRHDESTGRLLVHYRTEL